MAHNRLSYSSQDDSGDDVGPMPPPEDDAEPDIGPTLPPESNEREDGEKHADTRLDVGEVSS